MDTLMEQIIEDTTKLAGRIDQYIEDWILVSTSAIKKES